MLSVFTDSQLGSALALLIAAWLAYRLNLGKDALARRVAASDAIIAAFQPELTAIQQTNVDTRQHILTDAAFKKHQAAILTNRGRLSWPTRWRLRRAWRQLAYQKKEGERPLYAQYFDGGSLDKRPAIRTLAISRIERVIGAVS